MHSTFTSFKLNFTKNYIGIKFLHHFLINLNESNQEFAIFKFLHTFKLPPVLNEKNELSALIGIQKLLCRDKNLKEHTDL